MMKRFALVALVALSLGLVACSKEEQQETTTPAEGTVATESVDTATDSAAPADVATDSVVTPEATEGAH